MTVCPNCQFDPETGELPELEDWLTDLIQGVEKYHRNGRKKLVWEPEWTAYIYRHLTHIDERTAERVSRGLVSHPRAYKDYGRTFVNWYLKDAPTSLY